MVDLIEGWDSWLKGVRLLSKSSRENYLSDIGGGIGRLLSDCGRFPNSEPYKTFLSDTIHFHEAFLRRESARALPAPQQKSEALEARVESFIVVRDGKIGLRLHETPVYEENPYLLMKIRREYIALAKRIFGERQELITPRVTQEMFCDDNIQMLFGYYEEVDENCHTTIGRKLYSWRSWARFLQRTKQQGMSYLEDSVLFDMRAPENDSLPTPYMEEKQVIAFLKSIKDPRDKTIFALMFATGARVKEICELKLDDIDLENQTMTIRKGKRGKPAVVHLNKDIVEILEEYLGKRENIYHTIKKPEYLFLNYTNGGAVQGRALWYRFEDHMEEFRRTPLGKTIPKGISQRSLRTSFGTIFYEKSNHDVFATQKALRHARPTTTRIYARRSEQKIKEVIDKFRLKVAYADNKS